jgi:hypothetical protein
MAERGKNFHLSRNIIASYSMKIVLIVTIILAIWKREWIWVLMCFVGIIIGFIPMILKHDIKVTLPWSVELLIATILALNMGGILLNAYYTIPGYAGLFQFFTSILVAFFAFAVIFILDQYWDGLKMDKYAMAFVVVVTTMASASILEFVKWFQIFGMKSESVERVLISLFISTIAGIIMAMIGVSLIKKGKFEMMTEDLGKQIDSKIISKRKNKY